MIFLPMSGVLSTGSISTKAIGLCTIAYLCLGWVLNAEAATHQDVAAEWTLGVV